MAVGDGRGGKVGRCMLALEALALFPSEVGGSMLLLRISDLRCSSLYLL